MEFSDKLKNPEDLDNNNHQPCLVVLLLVSSLNKLHYSVEALVEVEAQYLEVEHPNKLQVDLEIQQQQPLQHLVVNKHKQVFLDSKKHNKLDLDNLQVC